MDWFLYDNGLRHKTVNQVIYKDLKPLSAKSYNVCQGPEYVIET